LYYLTLSALLANKRKHKPVTAIKMLLRRLIERSDNDLILLQKQRDERSRKSCALDTLPGLLGITGDLTDVAAGVVGTALTASTATTQ